MKRVLFVCSRNRLRSPTAERVFGARRDLDVASAGLAPDAEEPLTADLVEWAELIFVMEKRHRAALNRRFGRRLRHARVVCLDIPDDYGFMDPRLVQLLEARVGRHLP
ncbi:low molecular weight protein tyrosine phosphatase family protein [Methylopila musalis]|uniref:Low molecular weight protein tyrosine phosphatase family protein n=1 Tax=Methylopila musalis TaxID=1134781 RepID=A0ABW3Z8X2_9HYPH